MPHLDSAHLRHRCTIAHEVFGKKRVGEANPVPRCTENSQIDFRSTSDYMATIIDY
jgi:hypothetical protein